MILKLAWRNIWRNRRRTIITLSSIFFAVVLALFMRSMQEGMYATMIDNSVKMHAGYLQVQAPDYWKDKSVNKLLEASPGLIGQVQGQPGVTGVIPRLESFALAAADDKSKGAAIICTDPEAENAMTNLQGRVTAGRYFSPEGNGLMVGEGLAAYLQIGVGDTLVLLGQGYHGTNAVGKFPVVALLNLPNPQLGNSLVYLPLQTGQELFGAYGMASSLVVALQNYEQVAPVQAALKESLEAGEFDILSWQEMQPELVQLIQADRAGGIITLGILYMVVAFGIFGTITMMTIERVKEFGVLVAVGMSKLRLAGMVLLETLMLGLLGTGIATLAGLPLLAWMRENPIQLTGDAAKAMLDMGVQPVIDFSIAPQIFSSQVLAVLFIVLLCLLYPLFTIGRLKVVEAMR